MDTPPEGNFKRAGKCRNCPSGKGTPGRPRPGSDLRDARACKPIAKGHEARLLPLQRADVGLVAMAPEPPEHFSDIVRQSAEEDLRERERKTRTETAASQFIDDLRRRQLVSGDLFGLPDECFGVRERASSASVRRGGTGSVHRAQGTMSTVRVVGAAKTRPGEQASGAAVSRASKEQRNANETLQQRLRRKLIPLT